MLDAAMELAEQSKSFHDSVRFSGLRVAVAAYRRSITPSDPVAELLSAVRGVSRNEIGTDRAARLFSAIEAVEASREKSK